MIPGMGDPRQMQRMMAQMGIKSKELKAHRVVIEQDDANLVIDNPQITMIEMQGQKSFQIAGEVREEAKINDEDVKMVAETTGASENDARKALEQTKGDIAEAIMKLKKE